MSLVAIRGIIFDFSRTLYDPDARVLIDGAAELLGAIARSDYKLCLVGKKSPEDREALVSELGIDRYFLHTAFVDEKARQDFEECMRKMGLAASEIAVVGDRVRKEIRLGNELGMTTIWYKAGRFAGEIPACASEEPTYTVTKLADIYDCVRSHAAQRRSSESRRA